MHAGIDSLNVAAAAAIACYFPRLRAGVTGQSSRIAVRQLLVQGVELLPRPAGEPVAEHGAVQVVGLVLQAAGQQTGADHLDRLAVWSWPRQVARSGRASST